MVVYVRLGLKECGIVKRKISEFNQEFSKMQDTALNLRNVNSQKRREKTKGVSRVKDIREEIAKMKVMLPKLRVEKAPVSESRESTKKPVKLKEERQEKREYAAELKELRKRISSLK